jgi:hypothetical protein
MALRPLPHDAWNDYFAAYAASDGPRPQRLVYDLRDDLLEVEVPGFGHFICRPSAIRVEEARGRLRRLEIVQRDGAREVIEFR